jgi:hypothetical protein
VITFYVDGTQKYQLTTPSTAYTTNPMFMFLYTTSSYLPGIGNPPSASLPVYATITNVTVYP